MSATSTLAHHVGEDFAAADSEQRKPTAIILEPSKDLAEQTHDFMVRFKQYLRSPQLQCELLIGGTNPKQASRALQEGVDIITGTPGIEWESAIIQLHTTGCNGNATNASMVVYKAATQERKQTKRTITLYGKD